MPGRAECKQCASHYKDIKKTEPPCISKGECPNGECDLWKTNIFAWELWQKLSGQVIVAGMGEPLGIKFDAIGFIFDLYGIEDQLFKEDLFEKILIIDGVRMAYKTQELIKHKNKVKAKK